MPQRRGVITFCVTLLATPLHAAQVAHIELTSIAEATILPTAHRLATVNSSTSFVRSFMNNLSIPLVVLSAILVVGCAKKDASGSLPATDALPPVTQNAPAAPVAEPTAGQEEMAKKQQLMDYAIMEDKYINDVAGQWAESVNASSTFGDEAGKKPSEVNEASRVVGKPDGNEWTNNNQDMGFDWLEATFSKPVHATDVRVVFNAGDGVEAVSKLELQDTGGKWYTVWTGIGADKKDERGPRSWWTRSFPKTDYLVKAAKITIANNVQSGYKVVDAMQLVGN